ncbi:MAG: light-harvesting protein [Chromatiaceae bacterium]|nr:light-harvesting protein [Chromatiaceae bacterium]MCF7996837.1 light-harvesting protein [Chromatiaceae bacterium]MCF8017548.1 light-harvesting protein [Chromatiaceae bacterium]
MVFQKVLNYKPAEHDYRIWLVINPAVWLIPMFALVLLVALAVHAMVFAMPEYSWSKADGMEPTVQTIAAAPTQTQTAQ